MHFGFALELSDIYLWNIDFLDTHLDLLDTDIPIKYFVCLRNVFKTSSRHVSKTSCKMKNYYTKDVSWRRLEDMSWRCHACNITSSGLHLYQRNTPSLVFESKPFVDPLENRCSTKFTRKHLCLSLFLNNVQTFTDVLQNNCF